MSTCIELHQQRAATPLIERLAAPLVAQADYSVRFVKNVGNRVRSIHRRHVTEAALDALPENIRCDIGWPDLYQRQVSECEKQQ